MTRVARLAWNALFSTGFLVGLAFVWTGLRALVVGGAGVGTGLIGLAAGFSIWVALAAISAAASRRPGTGGRL